MASFPSFSPSLSCHHPQLSKPTVRSRLWSGMETPRTLSIAPPHFLRPLTFPMKHRPSIRFYPLSPFPSVTKISSFHAHHNQIEERHQPILRNLAEGAAFLIIGSLLFLGRFNGRPALALSDPPKSYDSAPMEERTDTQKGKDEDDDMYVRILEKEPKNVEALKMALYGKLKKGKVKESTEYVERLIALEPDEVEWRLLEALSYELMGQFAKAKRLFKEILKERPLLLRALHGLALTMHKNREGPAVFDMLSKALELAHCENKVTEERSIKILIAQMNVVKGNLEGALRQFQALANEDLRDFRPYLCQGIIYSLLDKKKEADEQFEIYRNLIPDEYPQRGFINDVILAAKTESQERFAKDFQSEFSYSK